MRYFFVFTATLFEKGKRRLCDSLKDKKLQRRGGKILEIVLLYGIMHGIEKPELLKMAVEAIGL